MLPIIAAFMEAYWTYTAPICISSQPKHQGYSLEDVIMVQ